MIPGKFIKINTSNKKSPFQILFLEVLNRIWSCIMKKNVRNRMDRTHSSFHSLKEREKQSDHSFKSIAARVTTQNKKASDKKTTDLMSRQTAAAQSFSSAMRNVLAAAAFTILPGTVNAVEMVNIPFTVYLTSFPADSTASSTFGKNHIFELFTEVNDIWKTAGIHCEVNAIEKIKIQSSKTFSSLQDRGSLRKHLLEISPKPNSPGNIWKVVIVKSFPVLGAGVYLPETKTIFYGETSRGGRTRAVNLAHEIGHSLGLIHINEMENLMHPRHGSRENEGMSTIISDDQISIARKQAMSGPMDIHLAQQLKSPDVLNGIEQKTRSLNNTENKPTRERIVDRFKRFDYDNDGQVHLSDIPSQKGKEIFHSMDKNSDNILDKEELHRDVSNGK